MFEREARWVTVREFPNYEISENGEIFNTRTQKLMRTSVNNHGHVKVNLTDFDGAQYTRSVALLVAESFVRSPGLMCDTVIILDGDFTNLRSDNLAWRPDGFAWKYTHQLKVQQPLNYHNLRVRNIVTGVEYDSIVQAGIAEGLLFEDIYNSTYMRGWEIFPTGSKFEVIR
jgi:hypothetical protein